MGIEGPCEPIVEEAVRFRSGPYMLGGVLAYPESRAPRGLVTVAGPHPYLGGDMNNNVVRALARGLAEHGWATLRFDYRGQGASEGPEIDVAANMACFWKTSHAPDDETKAEDLLAARRFLEDAAGLRRASDAVAHHAAAYSFGCWLSSLILDRMSASARLVLISPTVTKHDFSVLTACGLPKLIVTASNDFTCTAQELQAAVDTFAEPKRLVRIEAAEHFFKGVESDLVAAAAHFLAEGEDPCTD